MLQACQVGVYTCSTRMTAINSLLSRRKKREKMLVPVDPRVHSWNQFPRRSIDIFLGYQRSSATVESSIQIPIRRKYPPSWNGRFTFLRFRSTLRCFFPSIPTKSTLERIDFDLLLPLCENCGFCPVAVARGKLVRVKSGEFMTIVERMFVAWDFDM